MTDSKLSITLKAGTTFDSPWIVVHPGTVDEAVALLDEIASKGLDTAAANAAKELQAKYAVAATGPVQQVSSEIAQAVAQQGSPPAWATAPPLQIAPQPQQGGAGRTCDHGPMVYREAKPDSGKDWRAYFCPTPKGTQGQCQAQFLKRGEV